MYYIYKLWNMVFGYKLLNLDNTSNESLAIKFILSSIINRSATQLLVHRNLNYRGV